MERIAFAFPEDPEPQQHMFAFLPHDGQTLIFDEVPFKVVDVAQVANAIYSEPVARVTLAAA